MTEGPAAITRQAISFPGGSCGMRVGRGAIERIGRELRIVVGRPRKVALVSTASTDESYVTAVTRLLTDSDFRVAAMEVAEDGSERSVEGALALYRVLAREGITADDAIVVIGDSDLQALVSFVAATWCGSTSVVDVPTTLDACVVGAITPRALDVDGNEEMVASVGFPSESFCDLDHIALAGAGTDMARVTMVATSVIDSEEAFSRLAGRVDGIVGGDEAVLTEQLVDTAKCRGRIISATSVAVRQGIRYGCLFASGLGQALPEPVEPALLLAEGIRFASRVAASLADDEKGADLVFAQDGLLEELGLPEIPCDLDPTDLLASLRAACFRHTNRFLFTLPLSLGRVRLTPVDEDLLSEHLAAFCASRARLVPDEG